MQARERRFRLQFSRVLLTFSQVRHYEHIDELMGFHLAYLPETKYYLLGHELHQDGGHHYHLVIVFAEKLQIVDPAYFDWMFDEHPNIKTIKHGVKNLSRAMAYCKKDADFIEDGPDPCGPEAEKPSALVLQGIKDGKSDFELLEEHGVWVMSRLRQINETRAVWQAGKPESLLPYRIPIYNRGLQFGDLHDESVLKICDWIEHNVNVQNRDFRALNLWIVGPSRVGKSRLLGQLSRMVNSFYMPMNGYGNGYNDRYDLIFYDELEGQYSPAWLKAFCQGSAPFAVNCKLASVSPIKRRNQPVIITSNKTIEEVYHHVYELNPVSLEALKERFIVVRVTREFNIYSE